MAGVEQVGEVGRGVPDDLLVGASPAAIAGYLGAEDRDRFDAEYKAALVHARVTYDLAELHRVVERWRRMAALQVDVNGFRASMRAIAETLTGEPPPEDEPLAVTRRSAGI